MMCAVLVVHVLAARPSAHDSSQCRSVLSYAMSSLAGTPLPGKTAAAVRKADMRIVRCSCVSAGVLAAGASRHSRCAETHSCR